MLWEAREAKSKWQNKKSLVRPTTGAIAVVELKKRTKKILLGEQLMREPWLYRLPLIKNAFPVFGPELTKEMSSLKVFYVRGKQ